MRTPAHVLDYHDQADLDEQLLHGTAPDETFGRQAATPSLPADPDLIDCPRCHGDGEVRFNPSRINDPQCEQEAPCPDCHGEGTVDRPVICDRCELPAAPWVAVSDLFAINGLSCTCDGGPVHPIPVGDHGMRHVRLPHAEDRD